MGKYFVAIGTVLFIFCSVFIFLSYVSPFQNKTTPPVSTSSTGVELYFQPQVFSIACTGTHTSEIYLSSPKQTVSGIQLELQFDPNMLQNVTLTPTTPNFFGDKKNYTVTLNEIREQYGRASLALQLSPNQIERTGNKQVAILSFTFNPQRVSNFTQVTFLTKSTITSDTSDTSLLENSIPLVINCQVEAKNTSTPSSQLNTPQ